MTVQNVTIGDGQKAEVHLHLFTVAAKDGPAGRAANVGRVLDENGNEIPCGSPTWREYVKAALQSLDS